MHSFAPFSKLKISLNVAEILAEVLKEVPKKQDFATFIRILLKLAKFERKIFRDFPKGDISGPGLKKFCSLVFYLGAKLWRRVPAEHGPPSEGLLKV